MIQKSSQLIVCDTCTVWTVNVFHIYKGFQNKFGKFGDFFKISVRKIKPKSLIKKGKKYKSILIQHSFKKIKKDGSFLILKNNGCVLLKKRLTPVGKEIEGPVYFGLKRKKFSSSFSGII